MVLPEPLQPLGWRILIRVLPPFPCVLGTCVEALEKRKSGAKEQMGEERLIGKTRGVE
jgi:hypothetical protein